MKSSVLRIFITLLISLGWISPAGADEGIVIITNPTVDVNTLTLSQIKNIFLRKNLIDKNGNSWLPVNLPINHELRQSFSQTLLHQRPEQLEYYWNNLYFQGINPPDILQSEEAVLRFVAITPNAIGYVHLNKVNEYVRIFKLINPP